MGLASRVAAAWRSARYRWGWLDHLVRAGVRYDEADGGRLAAAVTYYAFFATFALALLAFAVFGFVLDDPTVLRVVQRYLAQNLPRLDVQALRDARSTVGTIAFAALPVTGWFWVDALRSSIRKVWRLPEYPGTLVVRVSFDLLVLVGLGLLLFSSLAVAFASTALTGKLFTALGTRAVPARWLLTVLGFVLGVGVNTLMSIAVLTGLPRLRMPLRRVLGPALLVAGGFEVLKTLGRLYIEHTQSNPTYQVVAGAVGLLLFLNVVNQLVLFAAALAATATTGQVADLAAGRMRDTPAIVDGGQDTGSARPLSLTAVRIAGRSAVLPPLTLAGRIREAVSMPAAYAHSDQFRGGRIHLCDLAGLEIRDCEVSGLKIVDCYGGDVYLGGAFERVVVNDVDVTAYVEAELDRQHPTRVLARNAASPVDYRAAWDAIERQWGATLDRARLLPEATLHERVDGEWSFVETQRHLLMAADAWLGNAVLEEDAPYHPLGLPYGGMPPDEAAKLGLTLEATPTLDEVLTPRLARMATMRRVVDRLTDAELDRVCGRKPADPYPDQEYRVRRCLTVVLKEEAEHHRYAVRDLAVLEAGATTG